MFLPAPGRAASRAARRSGSATADGLRAGRHLPPGADRDAGRRARLLPRVPERPLELPALRRRTCATSASTCSPSTSATTATATADPGYKPLQWVTDHEVARPPGGLAYLRSRPDPDPAGFGLFGVSRGGGTALVRRGRRPGRLGGRSPTGRSRPAGRCSPTSSAGPRSTSATRCFWTAHARTGSSTFVGWAGRLRSQRRLDCRFPDVERAVARLAPRPWLMIHGEKDAYIGPDDRPRPLRPGRRAQGTLDRPRGQAQPLPRGRARGLRAHGSSTSSAATPRAAPPARRRARARRRRAAVVAERPVAERAVPAAVDRAAIGRRDPLTS